MIISAFIMARYKLLLGLLSCAGLLGLAFLVTRPWIFLNNTMWVQLDTESTTLKAGTSMHNRTDPRPENQDFTCKHRFV